MIRLSLVALALALALALGVMAGCAATSSKTTAYSCADKDVRIEYLSEQTAVLYVQKNKFALDRVRSGSGERWSAGNVGFWTKGDSAMYLVDGQPDINCQLM